MACALVRACPTLVPSDLTSQVPGSARGALRGKFLLVSCGGVWGLSGLIESLGGLNNRSLRAPHLIRLPTLECGAVCLHPCGTGCSTLCATVSTGGCSIVSGCGGAGGLPPSSQPKQAVAQHCQGRPTSLGNCPRLVLSRKPETGRCLRSAVARQRALVAQILQH